MSQNQENYLEKSILVTVERFEMFFLGFGRFMYHNPNIFLFWALCVTLIKHLLSRLLFMVRITKNSYPTERDKYPMYHTPALKLSHCHVDETPLILSALYGMQTIII